MAADTIPCRVQDQAKNRADAPAYHVRRDGAWVPTSWRTYGEEIRQAARAMLALGFEPGARACILGFNRPEWTIFDHAAMLAGGVPAGIYTTCSAPEVRYIIGHAEAPIVLLEDAGQLAKVQKVREQLPKLKHVVMMKGAEAPEGSGAMTWEDFVAKAESVPDSRIEEILEGLKLGDLATLIYTSGTTGPPKAVMLSHENLAWTAEAAVNLVGAGPEDCALSYLPLSHIAEQMFSLHVPATVGYPIYFAEDLSKLPDNLKEVQPKVIFGVPRIWEKFHAAVSAKLAGATGLKAKIVSWARGVGTEVSGVRNEGGEISGVLAFKYRLANKLLFSKVKPLLGLGRARMCVSGAAPIAAEILQFFASLDVVIHEVYGQSEDTGPSTFNFPGATRFGTVGKPLPGTEVKIAEDGEILVRGKHVFMGYLNDPAATAEALQDGWLCSGDLGVFDAEGFLSITGRKKDIIITAGGKNIAPKNIEGALKNHELVNEAVVVGDRRKFLSALITLDPEALQTFGSAQGLGDGDLHGHSKVIEAVQAAVDHVNTLFARVEHIRKFRILPRNFTIEDKELTPTLKVKRRIVYENWAEVIEGMYAE